MSPSEIFRSWFAEVWNEQRPDRMSKFLTHDAVMHTVALDGQPVQGPDGFTPMFEALIGAFPDIAFEVEHVFGSGDFAAGRWTATMTYTGDHLGPKATGKRVKISGMAIIRCSDDKVVECWDQWDKLGMMTQIGAVAVAEQAAATA